MTTTIETIHNDLTELKKDVDFIKNILAENQELNDEVKMELKAARETPDSEYVDLE